MERNIIEQECFYPESHLYGGEKDTKEAAIVRHINRLIANGQEINEATSVEIIEFLQWCEENNY
jgi:hypothetical protein